MLTQLPRKIDKFLFEAPGAAEFLNFFRWVLYPYLIYLAWAQDWSVYLSMAPLAYHAPGFFGFPFPTYGILLSTQIAITLGAVLALHGRFFRLGAALVFAGSLLLDGWHNGFGFVEVRIHVIWLALLMTFHNPNQPSAISGLLFRLMELVVVMAYVQSAFNKFHHGGWAWIGHGSTLQIGLFRQGQPAGVWLASHAVLMPWLAGAAVAMEMSFLLYFPWRKIRNILLGSTLGFHISTWILMGIGFVHLWIFSASVLFFKVRRKECQL